MVLIDAEDLGYAFVEEWREMPAVSPPQLRQPPVLARDCATTVVTPARARHPPAGQTRHGRVVRREFLACGDGATSGNRHLIHEPAIRIARVIAVSNRVAILLKQVQVGADCGGAVRPSNRALLQLTVGDDGPSHDGDDISLAYGTRSELTLPMDGRMSNGDAWVAQNTR